MRPQSPEHAALRLLLELAAIVRLALAAAAGVAVGLALTPWSGEAHTRFLAAWDAAVIVYLALAWHVIHSLDAHGTRARVQGQDQSGYVVFLIVVAAAYASLAAITWGLRSIDAPSDGTWAVRVTLTLLALGGSWLLIHTVFAFHYARRYYQPHGGSDGHPRGLRFPGEREPDYMDFLYYACVIGMTSQVADVAITSRDMRRLTLVHGIASFAFNLVILALGVNLVAGAIQ